ncbi:uncharacterized protein THITE_2126217 [Thermothielavioides terrestris NRRL 8126]|uniref:Uncharacterized protein n=1 Tax=Thermothielavioides terrestris (strain ATCC 38088 / NRRL 8126) TaxID=578455 RepID=G2QUW6_THETT|nr:uncharacterized protein THITE_2126217 [Thermothielavioides terrestris NRRL 8126]AEO63761.1 hypothetical protein THITE_2126217 [Thermothielavioides terrestris NRRL 8126]
MADSPAEDKIVGLAGGDQSLAVEKPSRLLRVAREIRLHLYSFLLKRDDPIDTVLVPANTRMITFNSGFWGVKVEHIGATFRAHTKVMQHISDWDPKNIFLVCRLLHTEGSIYYYNNNLFDFHSPAQCHGWFARLSANTRSLVRHIAVPMTHISCPFEPRSFLTMLPDMAANLQTLYLADKICESDNPQSSNVRDWPDLVDDPTYWDKWRKRWGFTAAAGGSNQQHQDDSIPVGGPYRKITATTTPAGPGDDGENGDAETAPTQPGVDSMAWGRLDILLEQLAKMPRLKTVYLGPGFDAGWDQPVAQVLQQLETARDMEDLERKQEDVDMTGTE